MYITDKCPLAESRALWYSGKHLIGVLQRANPSEDGGAKPTDPERVAGLPGQSRRSGFVLEVEPPELRGNGDAGDALLQR